MIYANNSSPIIILLVILGVMVLIAALSYIIYRISHPRLKEDKPSQESVIKEEMDRRLQPIEDEKVAKEIEQYKEEEED